MVGVVETHGRAETEALLEGLEVDPAPRGRLPRPDARTRWTSTRSSRAAPRSRSSTSSRTPTRRARRHPKRYLDVEELLDAGIEVWSTVNIQHLESLNDVVAQITGVRVRETVPDGILDRADEVRLIDLSPEELLQRLREGKVYVPEQAERALQHFFQPGQLTALRELALRQTAEHVDEQMQAQRRAQAAPDVWPVAERLLVAIDGGPGSRGAAARGAAHRRAPRRAVDRGLRRAAALRRAPARRSAQRVARAAAARRAARRRGGDDSRARAWRRSCCASRASAT